MRAITEKQNCTGCSSCSNICPNYCLEMKSDSEGFWYPSLDAAKCVTCDLCKKACPMLQRTEVKNEPLAYACRSIDQSVRLASSSGGIFTLLAEQIISNRGVVFGASFNKNFAVMHSYVETMEKLEALRGSKYVQSKIGLSYKLVKEFLEQGKQVLFTGTPCQIAGLKSYLQQDYDNLFCVDIICHGVPSPKVWQKYVVYRGNCSGALIQRISFRRKDEGWKRYSVSVSFENDTEYLQTHDKDLYMRAFLQDVCLRPSCYSCDFKTLNRQSDITLADFWGIQNVLPEMDDDLGTSLVLLNSSSGKKMFEDIKNRISYKEVDLNQAITYNPAAVKSAMQNPKRRSFFNELERLPFNKLVNKYCSDSAIVRTKRIAQSVARVILKRSGLLKAVKKLRDNTRTQREHH